MDKPKEKKKLAEMVETIRMPDATDSTHNQPEDFVLPLIREIASEMAAPDIDLSTQAGAQQALSALSKHAQTLEQHRARIKKLKGVLEQKKYNH